VNEPANPSVSPEPSEADDSDGDDGDDGDDGADDGKETAAGEFEVTALSVSPDRITAGESVSVVVTLTNVGEKPVEDDVVPRVDGESVATEPVEVDGGASTSVTFEHRLGVPGSYEVSVKDASATGTVVFGQSAAVPAAAGGLGGSATPDDATDRNPLLALGLAGLLSGLLGAANVLGRRVTSPADPALP
jgi:hypothetical protein